MTTTTLTPPATVQSTTTPPHLRPLSPSLRDSLLTPMERAARRLRTRIELTTASEARFAERGNDELARQWAQRREAFEDALEIIEEEAARASLEEVA